MGAMPPQPPFKSFLLYVKDFPNPFLAGDFPCPFYEEVPHASFFMGASPPNPLRAVISHVSESLCSNKEFLTHSQIKAAISGFAVLNRAHIMEID